MKRVQIYIFTLGVMLVSCNSLDREAAKAYCNCYEEIAEATAEISGANETTEQLRLPKDFQELAVKAKACEKRWKKRYDGKIHLDRFEKEVKKTNKAVYDLAKSNGVF